MALARVVSFNGVNPQRIEEMKREIDGTQRPEGVPATEMTVPTIPRPRRRWPSCSSRPRRTSALG